MLNQNIDKRILKISFFCSIISILIAGLFPIIPIKLINPYADLKDYVMDIPYININFFLDPSIFILLFFSGTYQSGVLIILLSTVLVGSIYGYKITGKIQNAIYILILSIIFSIPILIVGSVFGAVIGSFIIH